MAKKLLRALGRILVITLGAFLFALAFAACFEPARIGFGGFTGIGQIVNAYLPAVPVGSVVLALNIPLFTLSWFLLGKGAMARSVYAMVCSSLFIDALDSLCAFPAMEKVPACVAGGVLVGAGLGLVITQGATTGGGDLLARLLKLKLPWLSMGRLLLCVDLVVIVAAALAFGSVESGVYGLIGLALSTAVMDKLLYGLDKAKVAYIITACPGQTARAIGETLERGVTVLPGKGAWSGQEREVLLCAFKQRQIVQLKALVKELDPDAFLIVTDAYEVLGDGFRSYQKNEV